MTPQIDGRSFKIDRAKLWNIVEAGEKRPDAQLARSLVLALPAEIDNQAKWLLTQKFVRDNFTSQGMIADVNIHDINSHNPHVHILLTMRDISEVTPSGEIVFGLKNRTWNDKKLLEQQKESWANTVNKYLELAQVPERIDHRTPTDRVPQIHIGSSAWEMEKRGIQTERGDLHREIAQTNQNIQLLRDAAAATQRSLEIELRLEVERREAAQREADKSKQKSTSERLARGGHLNRIVDRANELFPGAIGEEQRPVRPQPRLEPTIEPARPLARQEEDVLQWYADLQEQWENTHGSPVPEDLIAPETYTPNRLELVNWFRASEGDDRQRIADLGQQLKTAYMLQDFMQGQPEPDTLPNEFQSNTVAISLADKQQFEQKLAAWQQQKRETPLGNFIEKAKQLAAQDPTGRQTFETMKAVRTLNELAKEDPINRAGLKIINDRLISDYVTKTTDSENLNTLIVNLEHVRDNPEYYQHLERQQEIQRQNSNVRTNTRDRGGRGR
jgi:hypothetical protein